MTISGIGSAGGFQNQAPSVDTQSIEQKIQKLQERKARLSDEIITEGSISDTLATKEELFAILQD